jgi:hypothetical protein
MPKTPRQQKSAEAKSRKRAADDPAQYKRFREFARDQQADETKEAFDRIFETIIKTPR